VQVLLELVRLAEAQVNLGWPEQGGSNFDFSLYLDQAVAAAAQAGSATAGAPSPAAKGGPAPLNNLIDRVAADNGLPSSLLRAVVEAESGGNPAATSSAGAAGLMQLMPGTAASLGVTDPYDPVQNLYGGARYLKGLINRFGDLRLALAAYNSGPGTLSRLGVTNWERDRGMLPVETQAYVPKVMALYGAYG
jgi:soluble lytic murein transglycosylase-like protein